MRNLFLKNKKTTIKPINLGVQAGFTFQFLAVIALFLGLLKASKVA